MDIVKKLSRELKKKPEEAEKKAKPRGKPFPKGNTYGRANLGRHGSNGTDKVYLTKYRDVIKNVAEEGLGIVEACKKAKLAPTQFYNMKNRDAELTKVYYEALKRRADLDVEKVREAVMGSDKDTAFPAKIKTEFIKWITAKLNPERYGDVDARPPVNLEIKIGNETVSVDGYRGKK